MHWPPIRSRHAWSRPVSKSAASTRASFQGELWSRGGPTSSLCFSGANLVPLCGDHDDIRAFADRAARVPRMCSSVVGRRELAMPLWEMLAHEWGPAREVRADQPLLATGAPGGRDRDPQVRQVRPHELEPYLVSAIAMFIEEVGVDPRANDGGRGYRRRVANLIASGRAWARFENGEVVFKAEVGSLSRTVGQIQGVWVHPDRRGHGFGTLGTATVTDAVVASGRTASPVRQQLQHRRPDRVSAGRVRAGRDLLDGAAGLIAPPRRGG